MIHWARDDLGLALDAEFSIPEEQAQEMRAQIAETENMDKPFMELVAAYGNQMRRILVAARVLDEAELEAEENDFWAKIVQIAGKYGGKSPVNRWLSVIAKRQAIAAYRRLSRRNRFVAYRAEMSAKMRDAGEEDDLDLEGLADESIAASRSIQPDEAMEQEENKAAARRLVRYLERSENCATWLIRLRYIEGASYKQTAAEEHTTCSNMRTLISRAIRAVRQTLLDMYIREAERVEGFRVLAVDGLLGFAEESADEADVGGLHLGAVGEIGEFLPEGVALFGVFEEADLLEDGEEVGFEVFKILRGGEVLGSLGVWFGCWVVAGEFVEGESDGLGEVEGGVFGVGWDCEEEMAVGEFAVGEAVAFSAKDDGDVLLVWWQFCGKAGQGNGGGEAVSGSGGGADDEVGLGEGGLEGLESECVLQDGLGVGGGSLGGGVLEVAGVDEAEVGDAKVVHDAGDGADVFREGWFY